MADKGFGSKILETFFENKGKGSERAPEPAAEADDKSISLSYRAKRFGFQSDPAAGSDGKSPSDVMDELVRASDPAASTRASAPPVASTGPKVTVFPAMGSGGAGPASHEARAVSPSESTTAMRPKVPPAAVDFDAIFREAGMDVAELDRVRKAEELLKSLPPETPASLQKSIVEASLKAFGFETAKIVGATENQMKAIDTYLRVNEAANAKAGQEAEAQIAALTEKIAGLRAEVEKRGLAYEGLLAAAQLRKEQVQKVLDFFGQPKLA